MPNFVTYLEAKKIVKANGIKTARQYRSWALRPKTLPSAPHLYYSEWTTWNNFFDKLGKPKFVSFAEACRIVRKNKIKSCYSYRINRPNNLPAAPNIFYKEWRSWRDFFKTKWLSYKKARKIARSMNVETAEQYRNNVRFGDYDNIPVAPDKFYKNNGWIGWYDFLKPTGTSK